MPPAPTTRWIFGPVPDLVFGCGLGYAVLVLGLWILRPEMSLLAPWLPLVILVTGVPHYGATLLRVFGTAEARRRYARHAYVLGALVWAAFLVGLFRARAGSWLITLYLTWSPWHYSAQNYGLTLLFLRRRGVAPDPWTRRLLRASFIASYALVFLTCHRASSLGGSDPLYAAGPAYRFLPLGVPELLVRLAVPLCLGAYVAALGLGLRSLLRRDRVATLAPALALLLTQAAWFSLPALGCHFAPERCPSRIAALAFIWVALGHCVQYLWISLHHARASGEAGTGLPYLATATLLGAALWTAPALAFAPGAAGAGPGHVPFDAGLGLLVAAAVNLHHFILDGAIWKLRDPRVGGVLLAGRPGAGASAARQRRGPPSLGWSTLVTIGGLSVACWVAVVWEQEIGHRRAYAAGDRARVERAAFRLAALGRDGPQIHVALGRLKAREGQADDALAEFQRSLALAPSAAALVGIARIHEARGDWQAAYDAYQAALGLDPGHTTAFERSAQVWKRLARRP